MRKFLTLFVVVITLLLFPAFASAKVPQPGDPGVRVAKFWIGQKFYEVNGTKQTMDVAPTVKNGRTLLPVRYAGYALGLGEKDVDWNSAKREAALMRWWTNTPGYDKKYDYVVFTPGQTKFSVNGWPYGKLDQAAEIANGRVMVPFRAVCTALGALAFWDSKERSVTVVTWEKPPEPVKLTVKEVAVPRDKAVATIVYTDGRKVEVTTEKPAAVSVQGFKLDAAEYLKLWGIPEGAMLFDPVRGGFLVRGGAGHVTGSINCEAPYVAFYVGEKGWWGAFFDRWPAESDKDIDPMFIKDGMFWSGNAVGKVPGYLWGLAEDGSDLNGVLTLRLKT